MEKERNTFAMRLKAYNQNVHNASFLRLCVILVIILILVSVLKGDSFWTPTNLNSVLLQFPEYGLLGLAFMVAFCVGSTDLSVVGMANLTSVLSATIMKAALADGTMSAQQEILLIVGIFAFAFVVGLACGVFNGLLVNKIGIPAIIATLGTQYLFIGLAMAITEGPSISGISSMLSAMGNYSFFGVIPVPAVIFAVLAVIVALIIKMTTFGQKLFMTGSNVRAARFSGINTQRIILLAHIISGVLSAFAGIIMMARTNSANANFGSSYVMLAILVAVLGGSDPNGGYGSVAGVTISAIILQCLASTLNMFTGVSNFYRDLIWGALLVVVMVINYFAYQKRSRSIA